MTLPPAVRRLADVATDAARAVVADRVAPSLPVGHPWRSWSGLDAGGPRPWPSAMTSPACLVSVAAAVGPALDVFAGVAAAAGLRVERTAGAGGVPVCTVRGPRASVGGVLGEVALAAVVAAELPVPFVATAVHVRGHAVDGSTCVLRVEVEDHDAERDGFRRRLVDVLERFVEASAAHGVRVEVSPWEDRRPPTVVHVGRRPRGPVPR
ncbi:hypothetical protein CTKZ_13990 [Cellulomonas algicola]|uniref:Uncharacterized protein n=1 Tax=Cellulomonas algicola TaxID=2071633 RepID=A0A401UYS1_9CELL|nr:hypothetical protein [Cellulomonas algicola]GCD19837.1 hypothetical protein CTKZ_13990 [Cellulomonas algicola]